jgi:hypothetical protein
MVVSVLLSGRDHRSLDGDPWPGERSSRSRQARSEAEDGGRRLFCFSREECRHFAAGEKSRLELLREGDRGAAGPRA